MKDELLTKGSSGESILIESRSPEYLNIQLGKENISHAGALMAQWAHCLSHPTGPPHVLDPLGVPYRGDNAIGTIFKKIT